MLLITIETAGQQRQYLHESGPLVLGRQPGGDEAHLVIDAHGNAAAASPGGKAGGGRAGHRLIVHDLRGPLGNVQQLFEMWRAGAQDAVGQEDQRELIDASLAAALDLLDDSLEFCRGHIHVKPVRGTFAALLGKHLQLLRVDLLTVR